MFARFATGRAMPTRARIAAFLATPELMAKHGMLEDGRKIRKIAHAPRIQQATKRQAFGEIERLL